MARYQSPLQTRAFGAQEALQQESGAHREFFFNKIDPP